MLRNKAILIAVGLPTLGFSKTDRRVTAETSNREKAQVGRVRVVKNLLPNHVTRPVNALLDKVDDYVKKMTLPWDNRGTRLLPNEKYQEFMQKLAEFIDELNTLADLFMGKYDEYYEAAKAELGGMFSDSDFPTRGEIRSRMKIKVEPYPVPDGHGYDKLTGMQENIDDRIQEATVAARNDLYQRLAEPLGNLVSHLREKGQKGKVHHSMLRSVKEVLDTAPALNITEDKRFDEIRGDVIRAIEGIDVADLRDDPTKRTAVADAGDAALAAMAAYMGN